MNLLHITNLRKTYGSQVVLKQDLLDIPQGLHLLIGPNGSGKSTFMKILAGLIPFQGKILLHTDIELGKDHKAHRLSVNCCESEPIFPPYLIGNYLVEMFLQLKNGSQQQLQDIKDHLDITDFLDQKISSYSSGMKKKLALLLAFLGDPKLILLDEPFNALDKGAKHGLEHLIIQQTQAGSSFILATHVHQKQPNLPFATTLSIQNREIQLSQNQPQA